MIMHALRPSARDGAVWVAVAARGVSPVVRGLHRTLARRTTQGRPSCRSRQVSRTRARRPPRGQAAAVGAAAPSPPPVGATRAVAPSDLPTYTLVGTIGESLALLRAPDGAVEIRGVNESLNGLEVVSVRPGEARVRYNG